MARRCGVLAGGRARTRGILSVLPGGCCACGGLGQAILCVISDPCRKVRVKDGPPAYYRAMPLSTDLAAKSVHAAVAAIEIYNKPNFLYREEAFSLLMTNAWELLLKAKWVLDHQDAIESLYEMVKGGTGNVRPKENRSGNPISHGLTYIADLMAKDKKSGLEQPTFQNILALVEIRDNAAHLINKDLYIGRRVQEIGTASLRNYLLLATKWFNLDLSVYNFFLMPISFYHGFEAAEPITRADYPVQIQKLLTYLDEREATEGDDETRSQHVALRLETKLVRAKGAAAVEFRYTDDPNAPAIAVREEDVMRNYPLTYGDLSEALKNRYSDFLANGKYHRIRQELEKVPKFCLVRFLNPSRQGGSYQRFYNPNIFLEFDKHYTPLSK